uniref:Uncharacterized protein n=1 Tax=Rhizophora mucronata TaxID=61149 RepID=A0A2P2IZP9_RHIMU
MRITKKCLYLTQVTSF